MSPHPSRPPLRALRTACALLALGAAGCPSSINPAGGSGGNAGEAGTGGAGGDGGSGGDGGTSAGMGGTGGTAAGGFGGSAAAGGGGSGASTGGSGGSGASAGAGGGGGALCTPPAGSVDYPVESEQNDLKQTADVLAVGALGFTGEICPIADIDVFRVDVAAGGSSLIVDLDLDGTGACLPGGGLLVSVQDDGGVELAADSGGCVSLTGQSDPGLANVPAGIYYVKIEAPNLSMTDQYTLAVSAVAPGCGDGVVQLAAGEQCDDGGTVPGDGCDANCIIETVCGDGIIGGAEQCDDGGTISGDGCDASCNFEGMVCSEVEANDDLASANDMTGCNLIGGAIGVVGDADWFQIDVAVAGSSLRAEVTDQGGQGCPSGFDSYLRLYDATGNEIATDDDDGTDACSLLDPGVDAGAANLAVGTYYVSVREFFDDEAQPYYYLKLKLSPPGCGDGVKQAPEQCDDGNLVDTDACTNACTLQPSTPEVEPNGGIATATPLMAGTYAFEGAISPVGDQDWYAITVPAGASLILETSDSMNPTSCGFDTIITFYSPSMLQLATDDDDSAFGACSLLTGANGDAVENLAAGTYYVKVEEYLNDGTIPGYRLNVQIL